MLHHIQCKNVYTLKSNVRTYSPKFGFFRLCLCSLWRHEILAATGVVMVVIRSQKYVVLWLDVETSPRARRFPWWSWFPYEIPRRLIFSQLIKKTRFTSIEDGQNRYVCCKLRVDNKYLTHESWLGLTVDTYRASEFLESKHVVGLECGCQSPHKLCARRRYSAFTVTWYKFFYVSIVSTYETARGQMVRRGKNWSQVTACECIPRNSVV